MVQKTRMGAAVPELSAEAVTFDAASHQYHAGGIRVPSVTQVLSILTDYSMVPPDVLEWKRNLGSMVHLATELDDADDLADWDEQIDGYIAAWRRFKRECKYEYSLSERKVYSPQFGYAGTLDRICRVGNKPAILDIKTGSPSIGYVGPQTAAYLAAWCEETRTKPRDYKRYAVHLGGDGTYRLVTCADPMDWAVFLSCLNVWKWKNR